MVSAGVGDGGSSVGDAESLADGSEVSVGVGLPVVPADGSTDALGLVDPLGCWPGSFWSSPPESPLPTFPIVVRPESEPPVIDETL